MSNRYSYRQYGNVALIIEDDRAICTAKFEDGFWVAFTYPLIGEKAYPLYQMPPLQGARTLDEFVAQAEQRATR
jgi:hypothetical protein